MADTLCPPGDSDFGYSVCLQSSKPRMEPVAAIYPKNSQDHDSCSALCKSHYYLITIHTMSATLPARPLSDSIIIDALRRRGYKATPQRIAICRLVLSNPEHPTARRIYDQVKRVHPTVSIATVYKTIQVLRELRLVQELTFTHSDTRFDSNVTPHLNVVCLRCGTVSDVNDQAIRNLVGRVASNIRFTVTAQRFDIYGVCQNCAMHAKRI